MFLRVLIFTFLQFQNLFKSVNNEIDNLLYTIQAAYLLF